MTQMKYSWRFWIMAFLPIVRKGCVWLPLRPSCCGSSWRACRLPQPFFRAIRGRFPVVQGSYGSAEGHPWDRPRRPILYLFYLIGLIWTGEEVGACVACLDPTIKFSQFNRILIQLFIDGSNIVVECQLIDSFLVFFGLKLIGKLSGWGQSGQIPVKIAFLDEYGHT